MKLAPGIKLITVGPRDPGGGKCIWRNNKSDMYLGDNQFTYRQETLIPDGYDAVYCVVGLTSGSLTTAGQNVTQVFRIFLATTVDSVPCQDVNPKHFSPPPNDPVWREEWGLTKAFLATRVSLTAYKMDSKVPLETLPLVVAEAGPTWLSFREQNYLLAQ